VPKIESSNFLIMAQRLHNDLLMTQPQKMFRTSKMPLLLLENNRIDSASMWFRCLFETPLAVLTRIQRSISIVSTDFVITPEDDNRKGYSGSVFVKINCAKLCEYQESSGAKGWPARKADLTALC
jgi:hypothetical protein